ncbi:threonine-phosphate decarboxylase CobD [Antarctobacter heliothermus]|uniref:threonine-phosphate decarboxylase n=1 Tax=Antarctobacter heliothermus TaxID=74033 RepID=A0A239IQ42_9RHOB|nr:threonine-phosphate decarboxylase CobD [Antarctobacter heliothermus]SNS95163.1 L-threonine O-3-phosphate decarboxylase [Antarctobacter heliothermus]
MRDHGGDLDRAMAQYGEGDWLDLSTGINARSYPFPDLPARAWTALPTGAELAALIAAARAAYGAGEGVDCVPLAGAQAAIQLVPRLGTPEEARVVGPTYNEHAGSLQAQGWRVTQVDDIPGLKGAPLAVVVNPNNPDGRFWTPEELIDLAHHVGLLVVDESFADPVPEYSMVRYLDRLPEGVRIVVLRSFGKFYGLAGVRLGFALGARALIDPMRRMAGPWAVSGPAIAAGCRALADQAWQRAMIAQLARDAVRMDALAEKAGWTLVGGTVLFRTYDTGDAAAAQDRLAAARIWTRRFPYSDGWLRLGLPGPEADWARLETALVPSFSRA